MILTTDVNFIRLFQHNVSPKLCILNRNLTEYAYSSKNYAEKSFMKLAKGANVIKLFASIIY